MPRPTDATSRSPTISSSVATTIAKQEASSVRTLEGRQADGGSTDHNVCIDSHAVLSDGNVTCRPRRNRPPHQHRRPHAHHRRQQRQSVGDALGHERIVIGRRATPRSATRGASGRARRLRDTSYFPLGAISSRDRSPAPDTGRAARGSWRRAAGRSSPCGFVSRRGAAFARGRRARGVDESDPPTAAEPACVGATGRLRGLRLAAAPSPCALSSSASASVATAAATACTSVQCVPGGIGNTSRSSRIAPLFV